MGGARRPRPLLNIEDGVVIHERFGELIDIRQILEWALRSQLIDVRQTDHQHLVVPSAQGFIDDFELLVENVFSFVESLVEIVLDKIGDLVDFCDGNIALGAYFDLFCFLFRNKFGRIRDIFHVFVGTDFEDFQGIGCFKRRRYSVANREREICNLIEFNRVSLDSIGVRPALWVNW